MRAADHLHEPARGKSERVSRRTPLWLLTRNPDLRIAIASYEHGVARRWGRAIRNDVAEHPELGLSVRQDMAAAHEWQLDGHRGGVYCVGIGGALTGRPVDLLLLDDPVKDRKQADSQVYRDGVWDWWTNVARTRLAPGAPVVLILCMTGDTPVLMADGTERPLRDVRPGDAIATYEAGRLVTSVVRNWSSQGPDTIYKIRMKSGATVRANARHPFLTVRDGAEVWLRTDRLRPASRILRAIGGNTEASPAQSMTAMSQPAAKACACRITAEPVGLPATAHPLLRLVLALADQPSSSIATGSRSTITNASWESKAASVLSAMHSRMQPRAPITGPKCSASTTATTPEQCAVCSATAATSQSDMGAATLASYVRPLSTWSVVFDEVAAVEPAGVDEVYDIQVDRTENFIANGLVSHNTRWHEDDLAGRLLSQDGSPWRLINIPALADHNPEAGETDPLGRQPGEWMVSARGRTVAQWEQIRLDVGSRVFNALYQGRPSPDAGNVWRRTWWRRYSAPLWSQHPTAPDAYLVDECDEMVMSWDMTFKDTKSSDYVVGQVWARRGANLYLLDQIHRRLSFTDTMAAFKAMTARWPQATAKYVEDKANGTAIIDTFRSKIPGIVAVTPTESKYARANAVAPIIEAGNVHLPEASIALFDPEGLIDEAAAFPHGGHDDQVDATSQALAQLMLDGTGAQAWIDYIRRRAETVATQPTPAAPAGEAAPTSAVEPTPAPTEDPVAARKRVRDALHRGHHHR